MTLDNTNLPAPQSPYYTTDAFTDYAIRFIDEQTDVNMVSGKILNKVNLVNDWGIRLKEELGRKPTVEEVAKNMGVAENVVLEAIRLSSETIEDIKYEKTVPKE